MDKLTFIDHVLGTQDYSFYLAQWFFAFIGLGISLLLHSTKRDPDSINTPKDFSWRFLIQDNSKRIALAVLLLFVCLRFPEMLVTNFPELATWVQVRLAFATILGLSLDKVAQFMKEKNWFGLGNSLIREKIREENIS